MSVPEGSKVEMKNESKTEIEFRGNERCGQFKVYWRTSDMMQP